MQDTSSYSQRLRMLAFLKENRELTTHAARTGLDVMSPAARVHELRQRGHNIITQWEVVETSCGTAHRFAKYVLLPGAYHWPQAA